MSNRRRNNCSRNFLFSDYGTENQPKIIIPKLETLKNIRNVETVYTHYFDRGQVDFVNGAPPVSGVFCVSKDSGNVVCKSRCENPETKDKYNLLVVKHAMFGVEVQPCESEFQEQKFESVLQHHQMGCGCARNV